MKEKSAWLTAGNADVNWLSCVMYFSFSDTVVGQVLGTSSVSIPQCTHTSICVQFMANQAGELIQLENNISQKQKEVFWFYPAVKIP